MYKDAADRAAPYGLVVRLQMYVGSSEGSRTVIDSAPID